MPHEPLATDGRHWTQSALRRKLGSSGPLIRSELGASFPVLLLGRPRGSELGLKVGPPPQHHRGFGRSPFLGHASASLNRRLRYRDRPELGLGFRLLPPPPSTTGQAPPVPTALMTLPLATDTPRRPYIPHPPGHTLLLTHSQMHAHTLVNGRTHQGSCRKPSDKGRVRTVGTATWLTCPETGLLMGVTLLSRESLVPLTRGCRGLQALRGHWGSW